MRPSPGRSQAALAALGFGLLGDLQRIVHLDTEVADGALQLRVTEQKLNGPDVACPALDQGRLGSAHRMGAVRRGIEPNRRHPTPDYVSVLTR